MIHSAACGRDHSNFNWSPSADADSHFSVNSPAAITAGAKQHTPQNKAHGASRVSLPTAAFNGGNPTESVDRKKKKKRECVVVDVWCG